MFELLKEAIQANDNDEKPDMSNWYSLISDIEKLVPAVMQFHKWKGYVKKSARILFYREICSNPDIESTKNLTSGELWEIHKFLNDEDYGIEHCLDITSWFQKNAQAIYEYAPKVKEQKLANDKARRDAKKKHKSEIVPF